MACTRIPAVAGRTLGQFLISPIAHMVIATYLGLGGLMFLLRLMAYQTYDVHHVFSANVLILGLVFGLITMGLVAGERAGSTFEGLMTAPVSELEIAVGKYLGALAFFIIMEAPRVLLLLIMMVYVPEGRSLAWKEVFSSYIGVLLVLMHLAAVGLVLSAAVREQFLAAMLSISYGIVFGILLPIARQVPKIDEWPRARKVVEAVSFTMQYDVNFLEGPVMLGGVMFFVMTSVLGVFLTVLLLGSQRWR